LTSQLDVPFFMSILEKVVRDKTATPKVTS
jgi:hypothetical protein